MSRKDFFFDDFEQSASLKQSFCLVQSHDEDEYEEDDTEEVVDIEDEEEDEEEDQEEEVEIIVCCRLFDLLNITSFVHLFFERKFWNSGDNIFAFVV